MGELAGITAAITKLQALQAILQAGGYPGPGWHEKPVAANSLYERTNVIDGCAITLHIDPSVSPAFIRFVTVQFTPAFGGVDEYP